MLIQCVSILQDLPSKDQNQLILFGFKPSRNLFFELKNKQSIFQAKDLYQQHKALGITSPLGTAQGNDKPSEPMKVPHSHQLLMRSANENQNKDKL